MPLLVAALVFLTSAFIGAKFSAPGEPFLKTPSTTPMSAVCLDDTIAANGIDPAGINIPAKLTRINKPDRSNIEPGQGYEIPICKNTGSCDPSAPDEAEYVLVASNVVVDPLIFKSGFPNIPPQISDRQMVRQAQISSDATIQSTLTNRIYRTFCGDWCFTCAVEDTVCDADGGNCHCTGGAPVQLPFRGSFHCDFTFYLQDTNQKGEPQIVGGVLQNTQPVDPKLPVNGSLFAVYFRKGATVPKIARCSETGQKRGFLDANAQTGQTTLLYPPGSNQGWIFRLDAEVKNTEVNDLWSPFPSASNNVIVNPLPGTPGRYEVFKNLVHPTRDDAIYLVEEGKVAEALSLLATPTPPPAGIPTQPPTLTIRKIKYKEFDSVDTVNPTGVRSLQLGTFFPGNAADWIKNWFRESKPAIYLYPPVDTTLTVKLHPAGQLTISDPPYDTVLGWQNILAHSDGTLTYHGTTYPYLFYEADLRRFAVPDEGSLVAQQDLAGYFHTTLPRLGLLGREIEEFISYWLPRLREPYYFIHWLSPEKIQTIEPLTLSVQPDTQIRLRAYFKPLSRPFPVKPQQLPTPVTRQGFTLVEWGGILDE